MNIVLVEAPFSEAIIKKYPEQTAIVLARDNSGKVNPITLGWIMLTSHVPPMFAFSVGVTRYSLEVVRCAREFVIAFPTELQESETLLFGTRSDRDVDKLKLSGIRTSPAGKVNSLLLEDAAANFECRLVSEFPTGDHVIFVGEVIASYINHDAPGRLYTVGKGYKMAGLNIKS
jgi:flavin reductase (DIM6/NTAB) family NADH-FMN oxidoreductase RutF